MKLHQKLLTTYHQLKRKDARAARSHVHMEIFVLRQERNSYLSMSRSMG